METPHAMGLISLTPKDLIYIQPNENGAQITDFIYIEEEKLCMTELSGWSWHGQTWHVQIEQPCGIQPIIMWSPRNLKWKILVTHN